MDDYESKTKSLPASWQPAQPPPQPQISRVVLFICIGLVVVVLLAWLAISPPQPMILPMEVRP